MKWGVRWHGELVRILCHLTEMGFEPSRYNRVLDQVVPHIFLPPASAVKVIESELSLCLHVCELSHSRTV